MRKATLTGRLFYLCYIINMRDPNRIPKMLDLLKEFWIRNPDLRLGQLILNLTERSLPVDRFSEMFYQEDDETYKRLYAWYHDR